MDDPAGQGTSSGQRAYIRTIDKQHDHIEKNYPGLMKRLYDDFVKSFKGDAKRRSLLCDIEGVGAEEKVLSYLIGESPDYYTEKMNSVFLNCFEQERNTTTTEFKPYNPIYVRLAATDTDEAASGSDSGFESTSGCDSESKSEFDGEDVIMGGLKEKKKNPIAQKKALQVILAYNYFISGESISWGDRAWKPCISKAYSELMGIANLFTGIENVFNSLFRIFEILETGIMVKAVNSHKLSSGGEIDFGVLVSGSMTSEGHTELVKEYAAIIELKRPNAGFGIAWKLLNGQGWTPKERDAFFKLRDISVSPVGNPKSVANLLVKRKLGSWQNDAAAWAAAEEVLKRIGTKRVEAKYSIESKPGRSKSGSSISGKSKSEKLESWLNKSRDYFVIDDDDEPISITKLLSTSKFKECFDNSLNSIAQVTTHAAPNGCTSIAIADTLTVVTGSLGKVEKSTSVHSNPGSYDDVLDVHLHDTAMLQTHDEDSALYMLEYLCEAAMSNTMVRGVGDELLRVVDGVFQGGEITEDGQFEVYESMLQKDNLKFNTRDHSSKDVTLVESSKLLSVKVRDHALQALADFDKYFPAIKSKATQFTSDTFVIREWFRENPFEGAENNEPWYGRSKSVAKVMKRSDSDGKLYVLKEYFADEASVSRISHELEAYARISKLPINDKKHVTELVSFGSLDLDAGSPRLYLLLEYVEDYEASAMDSASEEEEVEKVDDILESVGIYHNDLEDRNYRWQCDSEGSWYIKVFDFDHATFNEELEMEE